MKNVITTFILSLITWSVSAQDTLTIGEVFDFETGDEFHLKNEIQQVIAQGERITITDKWFSANSDTVFYVQENDRYLVAPQGMFMPWSYSFSLTTDTVFYTNLDALITNYPAWVPGDSGLIANGWYNSWFMVDSALCGLDINGWNLGPIPLDFPGHSETYGRGVGRTRLYYMDEMDIVTSNWRMKYYKKGPFTCGTPDLTAAGTTEQQWSLGKVFPNPFSENLTFKFADQQAHAIRILDISGRQLMTMEVADGQTIDTNQLPKGTFMVQTVEGEMIARICK